MLGRQQIQAAFEVCRDFSIGRDTTSPPQSTTPSKLWYDYLLTLEGKDVQITVEKYRHTMSEQVVPRSEALCSRLRAGFATNGIVADKN